MIYTIGSLAAYKKAFEVYTEVYKLGPQDPGERYPEGYSGGYAFKTEADAQQRIDEAYTDTDFVIFKMDIEWAKTYPSEYGWWHHLKEDALVLWPPIT